MLASDLYQSEHKMQLNASITGVNSVLNLSTNGSAHGAGARKYLYGPVLTGVRQVMISRVAKPEEVLIVEDENGDIVRETTKYTDVIAQYKTMRETLVFLTHLNCDDTESIMLAKLTLQVDGSQWSWNNLNTLCWAIGSISGAMTEDEEKRFLVTVIKDLLGMCEQTRGKDNKAVIASNIMYVVGQYPRFLKAHWKFLKTVVNKLFEFMHESHPGVQDMACDTFLKIANKCKRKFVTLQVDEAQPFICELVENLPSIISDLEPHQIHAFYEAVGCMLSDKGPLVLIDRVALLGKLMELPNRTWSTIIANANSSTETLVQPDTIKEVIKVLKTNNRVCGAVGMALSGLAALASGMSQLEVGELGVASFSQTMRLLRPFNALFTVESGANIAGNLKFDEKHTRTALCIENVIAALEHASGGLHSSLQLAFIISDRRIERDS